MFIHHNTIQSIIIIIIIIIIVVVVVISIIIVVVVVVISIIIVVVIIISSSSSSSSSIIIQYNTNFICLFCFHFYKNCCISYIQGINNGEAAVKKPMGLLVTYSRLICGLFDSYKIKIGVLHTV